MIRLGSLLWGIDILLLQDLAFAAKMKGFRFLEEKVGSEKPTFLTKAQTLQSFSLLTFYS